MARVTVEDCTQVVGNRYELVLLAAQRARDISAGAAITVSRDNDKNTVVSLREIADQTIHLDELRRHIARGVNRVTDLNVEDETLLALSQTGPVVSAEGVTAEGGDFEEVSFEEIEEAPEADANAADVDLEDDDLDLSDMPSAEDIAAEIELEAAVEEEIPAV